ncbi:MAG: hypothetical protein RBR14_05770 [Candidatus Cloacimonas acidaminovorans]|nr:hypothetical protein [Candidatus Cloacimonas acidaminovorans]
MAKLSKNEREAKRLGISLSDYKAQRGKSNDYGSFIDEIFQEKVTTDFEEDYEKSGAKDIHLENAKALMTPYYEKQVGQYMEDLNAWSQMESVSYERSLRRARASMAVRGGAIGSEREGTEGEMAYDREADRRSKISTAERTVGTERIKGAGYNPVAGTPEEGSIYAEMTGAIEDTALTYKNDWLETKVSEANRKYRSKG